MADLSITAASVVKSSNTVIRDGILGATVTAGQQVYYDESAGTWKLMDANSATAAVRGSIDEGKKGTALNGGGAGQPVQVATGGRINLGATLTPGVAYYLSDTPGGVCPLADVGAGEYVHIVGVAYSASLIDLLYAYSPNTLS